MARITREDLEQVVGVINHDLACRDAEIRVRLDYAYGKPSAVTHKPAEPYLTEDLSPRLAAKDLYAWLSAYSEGLRQGISLPPSVDAEMLAQQIYTFIEDQLFDPFPVSDGYDKAGQRIHIVETIAMVLEDNLGKPYNLDAIKANLQKRG